MSVIDEKSIFMAMKQDGPFQVEDELSFGRVFSAHSRDWIKRYCSEAVTVTKYRAVRDHLFDLLQISSFDQVTNIMGDSREIKIRSIRSYALLANLYGISGEMSEIRNRIKEYAESADKVIYYLRSKVLANYQSNIEISNEIETTHNPVELLLITLDQRYHKKTRFEAKRKLVLMGLAGAIDQRERETQIEKKFSGFLEFLNQYVWSPKLKIGELKTAYLHSRHNEKDFSCDSVEIIEDISRVDNISLGDREKLTLVKRRLFQFSEKDIPVYVTVRKKDSAAKILKLLRKNEKNPAVAVDDELGLMAVLDTRSDVRRFVRHLTQSAIKADSVMVLEDISDTLTGGFYRGASVGSSSNTSMLKFFARIGGMRVEFIIHTNETYLNYRYQRGIAHEEYEVKRLFDSGVADFLFPKDLYNLDMTQIREKQLQSFRKSIEN